MYLVGLTGGIGSGKSTVSRLFSKLGVKVIDADISARAVVEPGSSALDEISQHFGQEMIQTDGNLKRKALRNRIFGNEQERKWLEALLHPLIYQHIEQQLKTAESSYAILESPLLLETSQHKLVSRVLVIDVPEQLQLQRALVRDHSNKQQIKAIMASQMSRQQRLSRADDVILNDGEYTSLEPQVLSLHQQYLIGAKKQL